MTPNASNHSHPASIRLLCLLMAGLTACSSGRSQYVWHDVGTQKLSGMPNPSQILDSWGARSEGPDVPDPMIAPGFLLKLHSLSDPKLNGDFRVEFNGDVQLPYDITVNTTGTTLTQIKRKLIAAYSPYFKTPSDIDIRVKERRYWVDVRGLVGKPGRFLVEPEASLDLVIGLAGGTSKEPPPPLYVRIQKGQKMFVLDLNQYYTQGEDHPQILGWLGGEVLFFQRAPGGSLGDRSASPYRVPIFMLGEVKRPGEYTLNPDGDFVDSLVEAGGFTDKADLDKIQIIRRTGGRKRVFEFAWKKFEQAPSPLQGDVVVVHADKQTKGERRTVLVATIISAITAIATTAILALSYNNGSLGNDNP